MNRHWQSFIDEQPWFLDDDQRVVAGPLAEPGSWRPPLRTAALLPRLAQLLAGAHTSTVAIDERPFVLFSWEGPDWVSSWLSPAATSDADIGLLPLHRDLLGVFGGIVERSNEPETTWLLNTNESLTLGEARHDATFLENYARAFDDVPGGIPIDLTAYYSISREANGNTTLCHRGTGEVLLFAPDHSFDDVDVLEGCPPYTLYRRRGGETFTAWVEAMAAQWAAAIEP